MAGIVEVLYDDEYGTDLLIDNLHNVNLLCERETLSTETHTSRDGSAMEVQFHPVHHTYYVLVSK